ncbi:MAG: hypothetical protein ORN83_01860 [Chthoniobacteraceae bacterium]|jgi:hypothetical protein|nr:hypothetical protein [Chthoniobacteraceae bacterium]
MTQHTTSASPAPVPAFLPAGSFARYAALTWDKKAYGDVSQEGRQRKIIRMISRAPDAPVQTQHNFQVGTIDSSSGNGPVLHAHDYPEIFIPVRAGYRVDYGTDGRNSATLGLYDAFSLPLFVPRRFEATEIAPRESQMLSIFDTTLQDARKGIFLSPEIAALNDAAGLPREFEVMEDMKDISSEEVEANHIARFLNLKVESVDGMRLRRLIGANDGDAALRTPHTIGVDFIEVEPGTQSQAYESDCREVYVALEGQPTILWSDRPVEMERLDVFSVAPRMKRAIAASGNSPALLLRVRDLTNKD